MFRNIKTTSFVIIKLREDERKKYHSRWKRRFYTILYIHIIHYKRSYNEKLLCVSVNFCNTLIWKIFFTFWKISGLRYFWTFQNMNPFFLSLFFFHFSLRLHNIYFMKTIMIVMKRFIYFMNIHFFIEAVL